jgi:hypothetical protein
MSTSAVSSSSLYQQLQSYFQARNNDVQQLGQALQSGNLSSAQTAFNNITALGQSGPFANGDAFRVQQREQDFNAIGQALQNGDLAGAQSAFASLQATFQHVTTANSGGPDQGAGGSGPEIVVNLSTAASSGASAGSAEGVGAGILVNAAPVTATSTGSGSTGSAGSSGASGGPEIVLNLNNASGSGATPEQITINVGQASGGAEQVSLSVGPEGASNPTEFQFNLNPNSNEQIVLNLLGTTSSSGTNSSGASGGLSVSA